MKTCSKPQAKILIVDDEPSVRNLLVAVLGEKFECTTAASAEEALACLNQEIYDLVLSDINMGGMSGIELIARVIESSEDTVVIMISGNQSIESPIEAIRGGAFDYVKKPFEVDQVEMCVDRALVHRQLLISKRQHEENLEDLIVERTGRLNFLAYHDLLTELPNRVSFEENLSRVLSIRPNRSGVAVLYVSLDRFTGLRDTLGHKMGDRLLVEVAKRLKGLSDNDLSTARLEGDEFVILINHTSAEAVGAFTDGVFEAFATPFSIGEYKIFVAASIGISRSPDDGVDAQTLLRNAGAALAYARKMPGNVCQFYTSGIHEQAVKRLALENDLRAALEKGEFVMYYQPKVDMFSGRVVGMEALVRWIHPEFGLIPPNDFIPLAEETGFIIPLGEWILRASCSQTKLWRDEGFELGVAVNLSAAQFQQKDLADKLITIVNETGLDPGFLNLEVTESSIMSNPAAAAHELSALRENGMSISIDDFGTGHSSLGYLKLLPMDVVKIDKSFIDDVTTNPDDAALVTAVVTLAHGLRLKVVAEGVETEDQLRFLKLMNCDEWQGYLYSRPLSTEAFGKLLHQLTDKNLNLKDTAAGSSGAI